MPWIRSRPFRQEPPVRTREAAAPFAFSPGPRAWRVRHILPAWRRTAAERAWYGSSPIAKTGRSCKRSCRRRSFILMTKKTPLPRSKAAAKRCLRRRRRSRDFAKGRTPRRCFSPAFSFVKKRRSPASSTRTGSISLRRSIIRRKRRLCFRKSRFLSSSRRIPGKWRVFLPL